MKITGRVDHLLDGGSIGIKTDKGEFFIDGRLKTDTKNALYLGYPDAEKGRKAGELVTDQKTKNELIKALVENRNACLKLETNATDQALQRLRR